MVSVKRAERGLAGRSKNETTNHFKLHYESAVVAVAVAAVAGVTGDARGKGYNVLGLLK